MRKPSIRVHNPCNQHTRFYRNYNLFWDRLTDRLAKSFDVHENRRFEAANTGGMPVELMAKTWNGLQIYECEYIVENMENMEFCVLSAFDVLSPATMRERHNPKLRKVLIAQFLAENVARDSREFFWKYSPWIYFPMTAHIDLDVYHYLRRQIPAFVDKMHFRGAAGSRPILAHFNPQLLDGVNPIGGPEAYYADAIKYKVGLSIGGRGEICYRDIEYMALGIPFLRFEYRSRLCPELVPDFHYISVKRPPDLPVDREGGAAHAKMLEARFAEVRGDAELLAFVARNAREYYLRYLAPHAAVEHTMDLLGIERDWTSI